MSVDHSHFLDCARELAQAQSDEMAWRNAGSRAYYSCWHATATLDNLIQEHADVPINAGIHEKRIKKFADYPTTRSNPNEFDRETAMAVRAVGHMLNILRSSRVIADYRIDGDYSQSDAKSSIVSATKLIDRVDQFCNQLTEREPG